MPARLVENRQPIKAVIDVLEHERYLRNTGKKSGTGELYEIIIRKEHRHIRKVIAKMNSSKKHVK